MAKNKWSEFIGFHASNSNVIKIKKVITIAHDRVRVFDVEGNILRMELKNEVINFATKVLIVGEYKGQDWADIMYFKEK